MFALMVNVSVSYEFFSNYQKNVGLFGQSSAS